MEEIKDKFMQIRISKKFKDKVKENLGDNPSAVVREVLRGLIEQKISCMEDILFCAYCEEPKKTLEEMYYLITPLGKMPQDEFEVVFVVCSTCFEKIATGILNKTISEDIVSQQMRALSEPEKVKQLTKAVIKLILSDTKGEKSMIGELRRFHDEIPNHLLNLLKLSRYYPQHYIIQKGQVFFRNITIKKHLKHLNNL